MIKNKRAESDRLIILLVVIGLIVGGYYIFLKKPPEISLFVEGYYDGDKNLIYSGDTYSIVDSIKDVEYIKLKILVNNPDIFSIKATIKEWNGPNFQVVEESKIKSGGEGIWLTDFIPAKYYEGTEKQFCVEVKSKTFFSTNISQKCVNVIFEEDEPIFPIILTSNCPSSGLTEVTLFAKSALASTATNVNIDYYVYDNGVLIKNGSTGADGTVSFDVLCGVDRTYQMIAINEQLYEGYYPRIVTIDASGPADVHNLPMYEFGQIDIVRVGSSTDPAGAAKISAGLGKNCGFTITFSENESASAFNKPLIICGVDESTVDSISMPLLQEIYIFPSRIQVQNGKKLYAFEYDEMIKSVDGAVKVEGKIQFSSVNAPSQSDTMDCRIIDQATWKKSNYKLLSLNDGFIEGTENEETLMDIGAPDSNIEKINFNGDYC